MPAFDAGAFDSVAFDTGDVVYLGSGWPILAEDTQMATAEQSVTVLAGRVDIYANRRETIEVE